MDVERSSAWDAQHVSTWVWCGVQAAGGGLVSDQRSLNLGPSEAVSLLIHINIQPFTAAVATPPNIIFRGIIAYFHSLFLPGELPP